MKKIYLKSIFCSIILNISQYAYSGENDILETYGSGNLAQNQSFKGDYINFGSWKGISIDGTITESDRIKASQNLYELVFTELGDCNQASILEVGCGIGNGCILLHNKFPHSNVVGIDITPEQIKRALVRHKDYLDQNPTVRFVNTHSDNTCLDDDSVDFIYSVEAAQYFPSMSDFAQEMHRILKKSGRLIVTAHFSTSAECYQKVKTLLPTVRNDIDLMIPIEDVRQAFISNGFKEIKFYEIGEDVFEGFDRWLAQIQDVDWSRNIYKAFKEGLINYYVIVLEK